jgi:lipopolysaccharide export LptBFGC system permease protein LptF
MGDPNKELISLHQAQMLMLVVLVLAPLIGLAWGAAKKRLVPGLVIGLLVGAGNYGLWTVYNAITEHLGLDTVKNLLVNLGLFVVVGLLVGVGAGMYASKTDHNNG